MAGGGGPQTGRVTGFGPSIQTGCLPAVLSSCFSKNVNPLSNMDLGSTCQPATATSSAAGKVDGCLVMLHEAQWMESSS